MIKVEKYFASWCQPCKQLTPILEEISKKYENQIDIVEINIEKNKDKVVEEGIRSVPTVIIYDEDDNEYVRVNGLNPKKEYVNIIENILN